MISQRNITTYLLISVMAFLLVATPVSPQGVQKAHALDAVTVISDVSATGLKNLVANSLSQFANTTIAGIEASLQLKENTLDSLVWAAGKTALQQITGDMIEWINSGFQGSPAFVTNLGDFLSNVSEQAAVAFVYGNELDLLCDTHEFEIRAALAIEYQEYGSRTFAPECPVNISTVDLNAFMSGDFSKGGWDMFFELFTSDSLDPHRAYLSASREMSVRTIEAQRVEETVVGWGDGFLSMKKCEPVVSSLGAVQERCDTVTPGSILQDMLSFNIGELPSLQLLQADEFNEVISVLMSGLTNQVLRGTNGLLGLGGNAQYTDNSFGAAGNSSYTSALSSASIYQQQSYAGDQIDQSLTAQNTYIALIDEIITKIEEVDQTLEQHWEQYPGCFELQMSSRLISIYDEYTTEEVDALTTRDILQNLQEQRDAAATAEEFQLVFSLYSQLQADGRLRTQIQNKELELNFIDIELFDLIYDFNEVIDDEADNCK